MQTKIKTSVCCVFLFAVFQMVAIAEQEKTPAVIDVKHPIYKFRERDGAGNIFIKPIEQLGRFTTNAKTGKPTHSNDMNNLEWSFTLAKKKFLVGEPITGKISVQNRATTVHYYMSSPYHGQDVSTLEFWRSRWEESADGKGKWGSLKAVYHESQGSFQSLQGKPIVLAPEEKHKNSIAVNVLHRSRGMSHIWHSGVGTYQPGKHRIYLRYVNLTHAVKRQEYWKNKKKKQGEHLFPVSCKPIVLGPYEVEIVPLKIPRENEITMLLKKWDIILASRARYPRSDTVVSVHDFMPESLEMASELPGAKFTAVRSSFLLTRVRQRFAQLESHPYKTSSKVSKTVKKKILQELERVTQLALKEEIPKAIAEAWKLTHCQILLAQNKKAEALKRAKATATPDTIMFVHRQLKTTTVKTD